MRIDKAIIVAGYNASINSEHKISSRVSCTNVNFTNIMCDALNDIFCKVVPFDVSNTFVEKGLKAMNRELLNLAKETKPDYIILMMGSVNILETTIQAIREMGVKTIGYFFDDLTMYERYSRYLIRYFDYTVTVDTPDVLEKYHKAGGRAFYWPNGVSTNEMHKLETTYQYDVSFVGKYSLDREMYIKNLERQYGIKTNLFGHGWEGSGLVSIEEMNRIFNQSKINLCFTRAMNGKTHLKGRIFEVTTSGGFLLTEYADNLECFYEINKEIACFDDIDELAEKIKYYLQHEDEREAIAKAGWEKANSNYTWNKHFEHIFEQIQDSDDDSNREPVLYEPTKDYRKNIRIRHMFFAIAFFIDNRDKRLCMEHFEAARNSGGWGFSIAIVEKMILYFPRSLAEKMILLAHKLNTWKNQWIIYLKVIADKMKTNRN